MKKPDLDITIRNALVQRLLAALQDSQPGSLVELRGSLAAGTSDAYSDIDLLWEVPDEVYQYCVYSLPGTLGKICPVASLRIDPAFRQSSTYRLIFVQFENLPLFWRLDLEIFARSVQRDPDAGRQEPSIPDPGWSPTHSALMNAIAAIKALLRNREETAQGLLVRAFERTGIPLPSGSSPELIYTLGTKIKDADPSQADLAQQVLTLHRQVFG